MTGAQADFASAVKAHPTVEAYRWLAATARRNGDEATAKDAEAKLEIEGRRGDFRTLSLSYSMANKDPNTALSLAQKDAEQRGGVYTHDALAFALFRQGKREEAKKEIELALSQGTKDPMLFAHAGLIYNALGDTQKAKALLDAAVSLNPFFDPVLLEEVNATRERLAPTSAPQP
jgi:tetratricopeptide (TPR) repeat protein